MPKGKSNPHLGKSYPLPTGPLSPVAYLLPRLNLTNAA